MKKLLFLTALFTSLLIGFAACSDKEDVPMSTAMCTKGTSVSETII